MSKLKLVVALLALGILVGCTDSPAKSPEVSDSIRKALDQASFKDVSVAQNRDKGVVTDEQWIWLNALRLAGAETYVWKPQDWQDGTVLEALR